MIRQLYLLIIFISLSSCNHPEGKKYERNQGSKKEFKSTNDEISVNQNVLQMELQKLWLLTERQRDAPNNTRKHSTGAIQRLITSSLTMSKLLTTGTKYDSSHADSLSLTKQPPSNRLNQNDLKQ